DGPKKRRVHAVDSGDEAFLAREPPNPEANSIGNRNWRKQDSGERHEDDPENNEKDSILKRHRCETKRCSAKRGWLIGTYTCVCHLDIDHSSLNTIHFSPRLGRSNAAAAPCEFVVRVAASKFRQLRRAARYLLLSSKPTQAALIARFEH